MSLIQIYATSVMYSSMVLSSGLRSDHQGAVAHMNIGDRGLFEAVLPQKHQA